MMHARPTRITEAWGHSFPYDPWHDTFQQYYREALRVYLARLGASFQVVAPRWSRAQAMLRRIRWSSRLSRLPVPISTTYKSLIDLSASACGARFAPGASLVGEYEFHLDNGRDVKVCIDSHDSGDITSSSMLAHSDIYFKTNYWIGKSYDSKVVSLFNADPTLIGHIEELEALRDEPSRYDLCAIMRVWGGQHEVEGVEHCLRLLEAAARVSGRKYLLACVPTGDVAAIRERLGKSGIASTSTLLPIKQLWQLAAQSRVNLIRLGMHQCVPWRLCDLLAMGTCTVLDQNPKTVWPVPLREGLHYLTLDLKTDFDRPMADEDAYRRIPELLGSIVADRERHGQVRRAAAEYFGRHLRPEHVGRVICDTLIARSGAKVETDSVNCEWSEKA